MNKLAPIVLFVYNRPLHTQQTIEALQKNDLALESELFIYSDGAKNAEAIKNVEDVRKYAHSVAGFKNVAVIEREQNWGLAKSIINGVTDTVNKYGKVIVLEDDLLTSTNFLRYMNESLNFYENEKNVYSITGYSFSNYVEDIDSTYFLKLTSSWSWATWKEKWEDFSYDEKIFETCLKDKKLFNYDNSYDYTGMVSNQLHAKINSWAIFWYASVFLKGGVTLYPAKSLVENIGFDGSGTHCSKTLSSTKNYDLKYTLTTDIYEKSIHRKIVASYLKKNNIMKNILKKIINIFRGNR